MVVDTLDEAYVSKGYLFYNPQPQKLTVRLINPEPSHINYDLYLAGVDELGQFTDIVYSLYEDGRDQQVSQIVDEGIYYIEVESLGAYDPSLKYKLSIHETQEPFRVNVTKVGSMNSIEGYVNYGYGHMWRVQYHMDVHGRLLDKDGRPIANETVIVVTWSGINDTRETNIIRTDANGEFNPSLTLQHAVGDYSYYNGWSTHYFDIIPLRFYSSDGRRLISNEFELYHFAYSMYGG